MPEERLLPHPFYLSATKKRGENPKLFRPKELREYVFPGIGLVMYDLFWVKYSLHLKLNKNYDLTEQNRLFLWAEKDGKKEPEESVLYYSLLSRYLSQITEIKDVSVGKIAARGWLFKRKWKNKILRGLKRFAKKPEEFDFEDFVESAFSSEFKTKCKRKEVDLVEILRAVMEANPPTSNNTEERVKEVISSFVKGVERVFREDEKLHGVNNNEVVIGPNIDFTEKVLGEVEDASLEPLANTNFRFRRKEVEAFIQALSLTQKGEYLLRSFVLIAYFDPLSNDNDSIKGKLRRVSDIYRKDDSFTDQAAGKFRGITLPESILGELEESCFFWALNFFLGDGEDIARKLLNEKREEEKSTLSTKDVEEYFQRSDNFRVNYIREIYKRLKQRWEGELSNLIENLRRKGESGVADYLELLSDCLEKNLEIEKTFLKLLNNQGTIEKEADDLHIVVNPYSDSSPSASFYAIDQAISWTKRVLRGGQNV